MQILPVLDLLNGVVVRGVAGKRESYRPIVSRICYSSNPLVVAGALRDAFGLSRFYLADLDAIVHSRPNLSLWRQLAETGFSLMIDGGFRDLNGVGMALESGATAAVLGLETIPGPGLLDEAVQQFGADRIVFSLDLQAGEPLGDKTGWGTDDALEIAAASIKCGITRLIVLDLAQVGLGEGVGTSTLPEKVRLQFPGIELITGGGVRDVRDLRRLAAIGVNGVLVATALHNGAISRDDLDSMANT